MVAVALHSGRPGGRGGSGGRWHLMRWRLWWHLGPLEEGGLLVEEPDVGREQEHVQEAQDNGDVELAIVSVGVGLAGLAGRLADVRVLLLQRGEGGGGLEQAEAVGPGAACCQPQHCQHAVEPAVQQRDELVACVRVVEHRVHHQRSHHEQPRQHSDGYEELRV